MRDDTLDEASGDIALFLRTAYRSVLISDKFDRSVSPLNPKVMVLRMLSASNDMTISDIGEKLSISRPNMTAILGSLHKEGLVRRIPDKDDRRKIHISITEKGKRVAGKVTSIVKDIIKERLSSLDNRELTGLHDAMQKVKRLFPEVKNEER